MRMNGLLATIGAMSLAASCSLASTDSKSKVPSIALEESGPFILVEARIDGQGPFHFALDTWLQGVVLDQAVFDRLEEIEGTPEAKLDDVTITIDGVTARTGSRRILDLATVWGDAAPAGVIGLPALGDLVTMDLAAGVLTVGQGLLPDATGVFSYGVEERDENVGRRNVGRIPISLSGKARTVDFEPLGFGPLAFPQTMREQFTLAGEPGLIGRSRNEQGVFDILGSNVEGDVTVGNIKLAKPSVFFSEGFEHASLGRGVLESLVVTIDFQNRRARIEQSARVDPLVQAANALRAQSGQNGLLRKRFNETKDGVRLVVLLSPT